MAGSTDKVELGYYYEKDTPKKHRFSIDDDQGISGSIYINRSRPIPKVIVLTRDEGLDLNKRS